MCDLGGLDVHNLTPTSCGVASTICTHELQECILLFSYLLSVYLVPAESNRQVTDLNVPFFIWISGFISFVLLHFYSPSKFAVFHFSMYIYSSLLHLSSYPIMSSSLYYTLYVWPDMEIENKAWQVMELEKSRHQLLQENQQLKEDISSLQSQCQNLQSSTVSSSTLSTKYASENEDLNSQMEAARALVEKLISENADLIEKVNELYIELNGRTATYNLSSALESDSLNGTAEYATITGGIPKSIEKISAANDIIVELVEDVSNKDDRIAIDNVDRDSLQNSSEIIESEEIIQISLDENITQGLELLAQESDDDNGGIPLSDAPLVGAPFRFISFVAKYVSGADLVNKNT